MLCSTTAVDVVVRSVHTAHNEVDRCLVLATSLKFVCVMRVTLTLPLLTMSMSLSRSFSKFRLAFLVAVLLTVLHRMGSGVKSFVDFCAI